MSSENDSRVSFGVPGEVNDWLARAADRRGQTPDDVCRQLVAVSHAIASDDEFSQTDLEDVTDLHSELETQREEFRELLEDVRSRVVQVKHETDAKAPADHAHANYATDDDLATIRSALEELESTVDDGFANFETVLEQLFAETETLEEHATLLATAVVDLREQRDAAAQRARRRAEADRLKRAANQLGIRTAVCDACDERVDLALLTEAACPHCTRGITDVVENTSFFGSHALETGDPPALEGQIEPPTTSSSAVFEAVEADVATDDGERDGSSQNGVADAKPEGTIR
ncbi:hypothetical protein [Natronorubrum texcoconense]|uniref:CopG family transcriptional regulator n=1 Tax=Natronorubrum texcoconense TaxID=1095776 RepID=A0A1G9DVI3_9EURY|nr:hypothetical protein [Natronorubrum texcoconense]SDK67859.1 hypothetical protein SAMN04515672_3642 [Natronorubrum texcoconense]